MKKIQCAFCKGKGKNPFHLPSKLAVCQVCGGKGKVSIKEPRIRCAYCKGTGVYPNGKRLTCTICKGRGMVTAVEGTTEKCPKCNGRGKEESGLSCTKCKGQGITHNGGTNVTK